MSRTRGRRERKSLGALISDRGEVVIVRDPELGRRQVKAIRDFLLSLRTRVDGAANSDADVGPKAAPTGSKG